jgi:hypothetical protein
MDDGRLDPGGGRTQPEVGMRRRDHGIPPGQDHHPAICGTIKDLAGVLLDILPREHPDLLLKERLHLGYVRPHQP